MRCIAICIAVLAGLAGLCGRAAAYPQFQLSRETTCTGCHISPAGGGLLNENGLNTADTMSQFGTKPEFMYGKLETPDWLILGGDLRGIAGYARAPQQYLLGLPMQADVYAHATKGAFSAQLTLGMRPTQVGNEALTYVWPREHYAMWQSRPGEREGEWIRAGHLMPVFGLRLVEHPIYTRRYGGTPLMAETYGLSFSVIRDKYEAHVTGFIDDPIYDAVQPANGAAAYGEYRFGDRTLLGGGFMFAGTYWQTTYRYALTAKHYLPTPGLLLQAEVQFINPVFRLDGVSDAGGVNQLAGLLMTSYSLTESIMIDVALGHYDENLRVRAVDRDCVDLNIHWFTTSHLELLLVTRIEVIGKGEGGPSSGWAMGQLHYRL